MARTLLMGTQEACTAASGTAKSFTEAAVVRLFNSNGSAQLVTVVETQGGSVVGTFTLPALTVEFLEKKPTHCVFAASTDVLGAKVGFTG